MVAKSGDRLLATQAVAALRDLLPVARIITPNLPEAADLLGCAESASRPQMEDQARALLALSAGAVLLKRGYLPGDTCPDLLAEPAGLTWFDAPGRPPPGRMAPVAPCHQRRPPLWASDCRCPTRRGVQKPMSRPRVPLPGR